MNRLYAVEGVYSLTGAMADHRLRLESRQIAPFLAALAGASLCPEPRSPAGPASRVWTHAGSTPCEGPSGEPRQGVDRGREIASPRVSMRRFAP